VNGARRQASALAYSQWRQLNRCRAGDCTAEAVGLQPGQIRADRAGISKTLPVQAAQEGSGPIGKVTLGDRREDRLQVLGTGGITGG
jgi:hypothetical protein